VVHLVHPQSLAGAGEPAAATATAVAATAAGRHRATQAAALGRQCHRCAHVKP